MKQKRSKSEAKAQNIRPVLYVRVYEVHVCMHTRYYLPMNAVLRKIHICTVHHHYYQNSLMNNEAELP